MRDVVAGDVRGGAVFRRNVIRGVSMGYVMQTSRTERIAQLFTPLTIRGLTVKKSLRDVADEHS